MPRRVTGTRPKTAAPIDGVNPSEKPDGNKRQPFDQFRLINKAAGEKKKKYKKNGMIQSRRLIKC
jgi:hypothetical protein